MQSHDSQIRLNETIQRLENSNKLQNDVNTMYSSFVRNVKCEMNEKLNSRRIRLSDSVSSNKKRRLKKPWWTDELSQQWNNMCAAEKDWRNESGRRNRNLKQFTCHFVNILTRQCNGLKGNIGSKYNRISIVWKSITHRTFGKRSAK